MSDVRRQRIVTLLLAAILCVSCEPPDDQIVFIYGHSQSPASSRSESMRFFKAELERRSEGRIRVLNYFSGVLGTEREMMDMVATGVMQGTRGGLFADANPKFVLFMLPFLVENWDQAEALVNSELAQRINTAAAANGFHIPATGISQGFRAHTNRVRPLTHPDDLQGLKMRVPPQLIYVLTAEAFGASPQEMPASEIYGALRMGVLDGQDNPPANIWDYKIFEVQDYMTVTHYSTGPDPFIVDLSWYRSLPGDLQVLFDDVAKETMRFSDRLNRESEQAMIEQLSSELSVNVLSSEQLQPFQALVQPVYAHFIERGIVTEAEIQEARDIARSADDLQ